jgi:hypothetical protein
MFITGNSFLVHSKVICDWTNNWCRVVGRNSCPCFPAWKAILHGATLLLIPSAVKPPTCMHPNRGVLWFVCFCFECFVVSGFHDIAFDWISIISGTIHQLQWLDATVDDSTTISSESVYTILLTWVDVPIFYVLLFGVVYLAWCDFAMDSSASVHQILCKSRKSCYGDSVND